LNAVARSFSDFRADEVIEGIEISTPVEPGTGARPLPALSWATDFAHIAQQAEAPEHAPPEDTRSLHSCITILTFMWFIVKFIAIILPTSNLGDMEYMNYIRTWMVLFLLLAQSAHASTSILSQGARNVKFPGGGNGFVNYGGAVAVGDGVTDDTQAILDALNMGRGTGGPASATPATIYIPPGNYRVTKMLQIWGGTSMIGEPSSPPTITLAPSSPFFAAGKANPFVVYNSLYNRPPYSNDWSSRDGITYATTNNVFDIYINGVNFTVSANNPGCTDVLLYAAAQQTGLRNSVLTRLDSTGNVLRNDLNGGGGVVQNVTCNGGRVAYEGAGYSGIALRNCTFNGPVDINGFWVVDFIACTFNNPSGSGFVLRSANGFTMDDCTFTAGTPLNPGGSPCHLENLNFSPGKVPSFLSGSADSSGHVVQYTTNNNGTYYNRIRASGMSANLSGPGVVKGSPLFNPAFPWPSASCVNVKNYGAKGDGSNDDTSAIRAAYAASNEVFFPPGTYIVNATINLGPGKKMYGTAPHQSTLVGNVGPLLNVTGRGVGGVVISGLSLYGNVSSPVVVWNGDVSSQMVDMSWGAPDNSTLCFDVQSGGGLFENMDLFSETSSSGHVIPATGCRISSTDGFYGYEFSVEHWGTSSQAALLVQNADKVYIRQSQYEASPIDILVTTSNDVSIGGAVGNYGDSDPYKILVSNTKVSLWCNQFFTTTGGIVSENGVVYGPGALDGYVDANP
jgi:hypothetical protein